MHILLAHLLEQSVLLEFLVERQKRTIELQLATHRKPAQNALVESLAS